MILYDSVFVKFSESTEKYDVTLNRIYWFFTIIIYIFKWLFCLINLAKEKEIAILLVLLLLPLIRFFMIGIPNLIHFLGKFKNNLVRLFMVVLILLESFCELPAHELCIQHIYFYSNYHKIYHLNTKYRVINMSFSLVEYLILSIFSISYIISSKYTFKIHIISFILVVFSLIMIGCIIFFLIVHFFVTNEIVKNVDKRIKNYINEFTSDKHEDEKDKVNYYNPYYKELEEKTEILDKSHHSDEIPIYKFEVQENIEKNIVIDDTFLNKINANTDVEKLLEKIRNKGKRIENNLTENTYKSKESHNDLIDVIDPIKIQDNYNIEQNCKTAKSKANTSQHFLKIPNENIQGNYSITQI